MKIKIMPNDSMAKEPAVKVPETVEQAIWLSGFSRSKVEREIRENDAVYVQNGNYWFVLKEDLTAAQEIAKRINRIGAFEVDPNAGTEDEDAGIQHVVISAEDGGEDILVHIQVNGEEILYERFNLNNPESIINTIHDRGYAEGYAEAFEEVERKLCPILGIECSL